MLYTIVIVSLFSVVMSRSSSDSLKDQYCTDPRTMRKHAAYTEWADAYSCTRHRCQPGGRNLAIYTVGCKRVEAPESAIECEEVVEDTNMQFPYCCTRLRCLVVVRGEVWTRVLGQPWETLPAAPWSHMYKMKKPPPVDGAFLPKGQTDSAGPIYELAEPETPVREKVLRTGNSKKDPKDCAQPVQRSSPQTPDIVIALSTGNDRKSAGSLRRVAKTSFGRGLERRTGVKRETVIDSSTPVAEDEQRNEIETEEAPVVTEKIPDTASYENYNNNFYPVGKTLKPHKKRAQYKEEYDYNTYPTTKAPKVQKVEPTTESWKQDHWADHDSEPKSNAGQQIHWIDTKTDTEAPSTYNNEPLSGEKKDEKPANLQALVDAIGTRMRDIEHVVQKMTSNVHSTSDSSVELRTQMDKENGLENGALKLKQPNTDASHYKRFSEQRHNSQYLHGGEYTTEPPLFVEESNLNGYYSDASNSLLRRANGPKALQIDRGSGPTSPQLEPSVCSNCKLEPQATYMAPVNTDTRRFPSNNAVSSQEEPKHKKHVHKKKKSRRSHKKHRKEEKKKFNKMSSTEDRNQNTVSLEDSSMLQ